jgi:hypothetical protein
VTKRVDAIPKEAGWRRVSYTTRCGWIDWAMPRPEGLPG